MCILTKSVIFIIIILIVLLDHLFFMLIAFYRSILSQ